MKRLLLLVVLLACALPASAATIFKSTFNCPAVNQLDNGNSGNPSACAEIGTLDRAGGWTTAAGRGWQILSAANYSGGEGGLGYRHYRGSNDNGVQGPGVNDNSGGIYMILTGARANIWLRYYTRWQSGFSWSGGEPIYTKEFYFFFNNSHVLGFQHTWGLNTQATGNFLSGWGWQDTMGGTQGDGQWHCIEYHMQQVSGGGANDVLEIWVDGVERMSINNANLGTGTYAEGVIGENQAQVVGSGNNDYYTDYDDIIISDSTRVGCIGGLSPSAPQNLRIVGWLLTLGTLAALAAGGIFYVSRVAGRSTGRGRVAAAAAQ